MEGSQDQDTVDNFTKIKKELDNGYLERLLSNVHDFDFSLLDAGTKLLIDSMVAKVTSEVGARPCRPELLATYDKKHCAKPKREVA